MIIGITGTDGAGKGTVVEYLVKEKGFAHYHARTLILEEVERQGLPADRAHLRIAGNHLRAQYGNDYVVRFFLARAKDSGDAQIVIDSLRTVAEAETLKAQGGILLAVDADQKLRFARVQQRRSSSDQVDFETFTRQEALENDDTDPHGMQKRRVVEMADHCLMNDGTIEDLHRGIEAFLDTVEAN